MSNNKNIKKVLPILLLGLLGAVVGYMIGNVAKDNNSLPASLSPIELIALIIAILPTFIFVIAVHEAGHAIAGILLNFDFRFFVAGPFIFEKENENWHFKWNKNMNLAGGLVLCLPKDSLNLSKRFVLFAAGGPIASLILSLFFYFIYWLVNTINVSDSLWHHSMNALFIMIAALSAIIFVVTSIPLHYSGFYTDGARILRLLRGDETSKLEVLMLKIIANNTSGTRPKNYNWLELEEAHAIAHKIGDPFSVYFHGFFHHAAFDMGELDKAEHHLKNYIGEIEKIAEDFRSSIWLDASFFYAYAKNDLSKAELYFGKYKPSLMLPKAQLYAAEAMILKLKNQSEAMKNKIDEAVKELPNMIDKGLAISLKERLLKMITE